MLTRFHAICRNSEQLLQPCHSLVIYLANQTASNVLARIHQSDTVDEVDLSDVAQELHGLADIADALLGFFRDQAEPDARSGPPSAVSAVQPPKILSFVDVVMHMKDTRDMTVAASWQTSCHGCCHTATIISPIQPNSFHCYRDQSAAGVGL